MAQAGLKPAKSLYLCLPSAEMTAYATMLNTFGNPDYEVCSAQDGGKQWHSEEEDGSGEHTLRGV